MQHIRLLLGKVEGFNKLRSWIYRIRPYKQKFRVYYNTNAWNCPGSRSGPGSTPQATIALREAWPMILGQYEIQRVLDLGCGDFTWMRTLNLSGLEYVGVDVVPELIADNNRKFGADHIAFLCKDFVRESIPAMDLIICRDCFIHYDNKRIMRTLARIKESGSRYLLTTTYPGEPLNKDLFAVGWFRPINLREPPFAFPKPLVLIEENVEQGKCIGLWRISDLP